MSKRTFLLISMLIALLLMAAQCSSAPAPTKEVKVEPTKEEAKAEPTKEEAKAEPTKETAKTEGCNDPLGCITVAAGDPIRIAAAMTIAGPNASLGTDSMHGMEIALDDRGPVKGHKVEIQADDEGCSAEGGQAASTKIASDKSIVAIVGHTCSSSCTPAAPIYDEAGMTMISASCTAPALTAVGSHKPSFMRTALNDNVQGKAVAEFAYNKLGVRKAATIHDGSPYAEQLQQVFADVFKKLGGEIVAQEAINVNDTDMRPVLTSIAAKKPDFLYYPIFIAEGGFITTQAKEISGLEKVILAGSDGLNSPDFLKAAGQAAEGMYVSSPVAASGAAYDDFLKKHQAKYGTPPPSAFHAHAYDATNIILNALEKVVKQDKDGNLLIGRKALRDAMYATKEYKGITGNLTCNENGDCANPSVGITQIKDGKFEPVKDAGTAEGASSDPECAYGGLIKKIEAVDDLTVKFSLCKADVAFPSKMAFTAFNIQSSDYLEKTKGKGDLLEKPIGTGPYQLAEWKKGESVTLKKYSDYWGDSAKTDKIIFRWSTEGAQRLLELQSGNVDGIDNPTTDDFAKIAADPTLKLYPREGMNVFYLGMNNAYPPFDNELVRQAIAYGIDRDRIVKNFYPAGSSVATHFTPCSIPGGCEGTEFPKYDVKKAKELLTKAGYPDGFKTEIAYRDVARGYLPEPGVVAQDIQAQLKAIGITVDIAVMESGAFLDAAKEGRLKGFHMLGWGADYPDQTNFLDYHFGTGATKQFGTGFPDIHDVLKKAASTADQTERTKLYGSANGLLVTHVPMVPVAHGGSAVAFKAEVKGAHAAPLTNEYFAVMEAPGKDTLVWMQNAEPISVYCADEEDGETLRLCEQMFESLLTYEVGGTAVKPSLAEKYEANKDLTEWTFHLRKDIKFHDGSSFDAKDVVVSYEAQWDAASPLHTGRTGNFAYFKALFDNFKNAPK